MRIVNKTKFIRSNVILAILISSIVIFATKTYSNVETKYKEEYVCTGDTLWSIAQEELENNKYFEGKDIRYYKYYTFFSSFCQTICKIIEN